MPYPNFACDCLYKSNLLESLGLKVICVDPGLRRTEIRDQQSLA